MDLPACPECVAIQQEFRKAAREMQVRHFPGDLIVFRLLRYLQSLDAEECARMREKSALWKTWRRREEHRIRTGHAVSLLPPLPPGALVNPN
jgi:hypothetical protein